MWRESRLINFLYEINTLLDFYDSVSISLEKFRELFCPNSQAKLHSFKPMARRKIKEMIRQLNLSLIIFIRNNHIVFKKDKEVM